jgi:hypothetical protein
MTVKLHVGYVGITREGKRVEIKSSNVTTGTYPWLATSLDTYTSSGDYYHSDPERRDIIGPWVETPVEPLVDYNDGQWHSWSGGACPVHPSSVVDCVWHDEPVNRAGTMGRIAGIDKDHSSVCWERVIKFRVTKEYVEPPKVPREFWLQSVGNGLSDVKTEKPSDMYGYIHVREVLTDD